MTTATAEAPNLEATIKTTLDAVLKPVIEQQTRLEQQFAELQKPRGKVSQLYGGGAPAIRTGENIMSSRGYQFWRVQATMQGVDFGGDAKIEKELSDRLYQYYRDKGGITKSHKDAILAPLSASMIPDPALAREVQQMLDTGVDGYDPERLYRAFTPNERRKLRNEMRQALSQYDDTGLATFLGPTGRGDMVELLRNMTVFDKLGCTNMTLPPNGQFEWPAQTGAARAYWVGEVPGDQSTPGISKSAPTSGGFSLKAKKLATIVTTPNDMLRFAAPDLEGFLRRDMSKSLAVEADRSMIEGIGGTRSVKGVINYDGVRNAKYVAGTVGSNGDTFTVEDVAMMQAILDERNHNSADPSAAWLMRPRMWAWIRNRRASAITAGDNLGPYIFNINRDMAAGPAQELDAINVLRSPQLSANRVKGSASNLQYLMLGLWEHWIIGRLGVLEFATSVEGDTVFAADQTSTRCIQYIDAAPRYEDAFLMCDNLLI